MHVFVCVFLRVSVCAQYIIYTRLFFSLSLSLSFSLSLSLCYIYLHRYHIFTLGPKPPIFTLLPLVFPTKTVSRTTAGAACQGSDAGKRARDWSRWEKTAAAKSPEAWPWRGSLSLSLLWQLYYVIYRYICVCSIYIYGNM